MRVIERVVVAAETAVEGQEHQPPGIERRSWRRRDAQDERDGPGPVGAEGGLDDRVLGVEAGEASHGRVNGIPRPVIAIVPISITAQVWGSFFHSPPMLRMSCS